MVEFVAGLIVVFFAWAGVSMLVAASRALAASESAVLRTASLLTSGAAIWLTYDLIKFLLVG